MACLETSTSRSASLFDAEGRCTIECALHHARSANVFEMNCGPLSHAILSGRPQIANQSLNSDDATVRDWPHATGHA